MHNAAFAALGVDWVYVALPLDDADPVSTLRAAWHLGLAGISVTMPFKAAASLAAQEMSPLVAKLGAANTLVRGEAGWIAENTDVPGFRAFLVDGVGFDVAGCDVGIVGAGGAAAAVAEAVVEAGAAAVRVWNRTAQRAADLAVRVGEPVTVAVSPTELGGCDVVVGCVPAGVEPPEIGFRRDQLVVDLVYAPPRTPLMEKAAASGAEVHNGIGLLVEQAAIQFTLWTGRPAPRGAMSAAVLAALSPAGGLTG
jgi:shikimate dehydrogenase